MVDVIGMVAGPAATAALEAQYIQDVKVGVLLRPTLKAVEQRIRRNGGTQEDVGAALGGVDVNVPLDSLTEPQLVPIVQAVRRLREQRDSGGTLTREQEGLVVGLEQAETALAAERGSLAPATGRMRRLNRDTAEMVAGNGPRDPLNGPLLALEGGPGTGPGPITLAGPDRPGSVVYTTQDSLGQTEIVNVTRNNGRLIARDADGHLLAAGTEVTCTVDDGRGHVKTALYKVEEAGVMVKVPQTQNTQASRGTGGMSVP